MRASKQRQIETIQQTPTATTKGYLANWLIICTLPHSEPTSPIYTRRTNDCTLNMVSGVDEKGEFIGLPYGPIARLLLFWIISEAIRTKSRVLHLGKEINDFLRAMGLDPNTGGGKRSDRAGLKRQMPKLFRCRMSFDRVATTTNQTGHKWKDMSVAPEGEDWFTIKNPEQGGLFESWIELDEKFYEAITSSPVPIDFRAMVALKHSAMAIDLYALLAWRVHGMKDGSTVPIPLHGPKGLAAQIGSNYGRKIDFKRAVEAGLKDVEMVWPSLAYEVSDTHLTVSKSAVPIADEPINKKRRAFGQVKANALLSDTEIEFRKANPRVSLTSVKKAFFAFLKREQIEPQDIDALFRDYAAKWVKGEH